MRRRRRKQAGCCNPLFRGGCLSVFIVVPLLLHYGLYFFKRGPRPFRPEIIAHRGGPVYGPENTLAAFKHAVSNGVDRLEMDVQLTRDGEVVVIHDETVDRTTNGNGAVANLTLSEIRALDAGNGEKIPTFDEVVTLAKEAGVALLPEIKSPHLYPGIEAKVIAAIINADYIDYTIVQSFDPKSVETFYRLNPNIQLCQLYGFGQLNVRGPQPGQADRVSLMAEMVVLNPWMVEQSRAEGRQVFVWFGYIEHPLVMQFLLSLGVDGLIVDDTLALARILDR